MFTAEELAALAAADAEIEREFRLTQAEIRDAAERDREARLASYDTHKAQIAAYHRAYYAAHKDEKAAYNQAYYAAHKDKSAAYIRAYYAAHKDEKAEYNRAYYAAHKDEIKKRRWQNSKKTKGAQDANDRDVIT